MEVCLVKRNLGLSKCAKMPAQIKGMITTPSSFKLTEEEALDPEVWQDAILDTISNRIYLWPDFVGFTDNSEAAVYERTSLAVIVVRDGRYEFKFDVKESLCIHKAMYTHRAISGRVFLLDSDNQLVGTTDSDGNFMGFKVQLLNTEKMQFSNGTVSSKSPVVVVLSDNLEMDRNGAMLDAGFIADLDRLTDVSLELVAGTAGANSLQFDASVTCDGTVLEGLVLADVYFTKADGAAQTTPATSLVPSTTVPGRYTLSKVAGTAWVDGLLGLVAPTALTIQAYELSAVVEVDIP